MGDSDSESSIDETALSELGDEDQEGDSEAPDYMELGASDTESDEDEEEEEENDEADSDTATQEPSPQSKSTAELVKENIQKKYEESKGKKLFVRFPSKLPDTEDEFQRKVQSLSPLVVAGHKPRQKHARFCLVDFNSKEDRDAALKHIRKLAKGEESPLKGVYATIPRTEDDHFLEDLAEKKLQSLENKKAKARLKKASKLALRQKNFTSSIVVLNLPKSTSTVDIRKLFPHAVDIQIKPGRGDANPSSLAVITLPSTMDARAAVKQKLSLGGAKLLIRFDTKKQKHSKKVQKKKKNKKVSAAVSPSKPSTATDA